MQANRYSVEFTEEALQNLRRYPKPDQTRILDRIERLAVDPERTPNVKRLVEFDVAYRLRVGNYRVLFDRDDAIRVIDIIDILPRGSAYRRK